MKDARISMLARNLISYSLELKAGENILIELFDEGEDLVAELVKEAYFVGAKPFISIKNRKLLRELISGTDAEHMANVGKYEAIRMKEMNAYIAIRGFNNALEYSDIASEKMSIYRSKWVKPVHFDIRIPKTKWCLMNYPTRPMSQAANMSTEQFENFYFDVCSLDYSKMSKAMDPLVELMSKTDKVRITGVGT
ncbi:MAG TPA: aminopeptidase, partial [Patescibacteria group bacterium]|nr:aminopeptidase [Patescibacteria group bacterium]